MADPRKDYAIIDIEGSPYRICLNFNACCTFEELRGKRIGELFASFVAPEGGEGEAKAMAAAKAFIGALSAADIRALLYCLLLKYHPEITEGRVGELIHAGNFMDLWRSLQAALVPFVPKTEGSEDARPFALASAQTG